MPEDLIAAGTGRLINAIEQASYVRAEPRPDWHIAVSSVLADLEEALRHLEIGCYGNVPEDVQMAISGLASIWLDPDQKDAVFLGESSSAKPPALPESCKEITDG